MSNVTQCLRPVITGVHRLAAIWSPVARLYLTLWRWVASGLSPFQRNQLLNTLKAVTWPDEALRAQQVVLGADTQVRLIPHNGEFDFAVVLGGNVPHEPEVIAFLDRRAADYDAIVEIGANVGMFTLFLSQKLAKANRSGRLFSFEPSRSAYRRLLENLAINGCGNVHTFNCAVGSQTGFATFHEPQGHLMNGSLDPQFAACFSTNIRSSPVAVLGSDLIESLVGNAGRVLIKIDTEGAEALILNSMAGVIQRLQPDLILEVLPEYETSIREAVASAAPDYVAYGIGPDGLQRQDCVASHSFRDCFLVPKGRAV